MTLYPDPLRIELFGDRVESLRFFSAGDQRHIGAASEAVLLPAREAILKPDALPEILQRIRLQAAELNLPPTQVRKITTSLSQQETFPGNESLLPLIYPQLESFFDYLPGDALCVAAGLEALESAATEFEALAATTYAAAVDRQSFCAPPESLYLPWAEARRRLGAQSQDPRWSRLRPQTPDEEAAAEWLGSAGTRLLEKMLAQTDVVR